jgi:8-oxo-dGTP pyrophosphatase MutT (NUDIX family)
MPQLRGFHYAGVSLRFGTKVLLLWNKERESWELPGGTVDDTDPTYLAAALRELGEETSLGAVGAPEWVMGTAPMGTPGAGIVFGFNIDRAKNLPPTPTLSDEHSDYAWFEITNLPEAIHTVCIHPILRWQYNEIDLYKLIQRGILLGPNSYFNQVLFPVRITGTGIAFRLGKMNFTFRNPDDYLNPEFIERCNGLQLLWQHATEELADGNTLARQAIGTTVAPYVKQQEVWGVAKVLNLDAAQTMATGAYSTSPSFITQIDSRATSGGIDFTVEGQPIHLDHLGIVDMGVWDKLGEPSGVDTPITLRPIPLTFLEEYNMPDPVTDPVVEPVADAVTEIQPDANEDRFKKLEDSFATMTDSMTKLCDALLPKPATTTDAAVDPAANATDPAPLNEAGGFGDEAPLPGDTAVQDNLTATALKEALAAKDAVIGALQKQVDTLASSMPRDLSDDDRNELSAAEAKADSVFLALGKTCPHPLMNENHTSYRRRTAKTLQQFSKRFGKVDLGVLDAPSFAAIEGEIYKDAMEAARSPEGTPVGTLIPVKRRSFGGREIIEYRGSPKAFLAPWSEMPKRAKAKSQRAA